MQLVYFSHVPVCSLSFTGVFQISPKTLKHTSKERNCTFKTSQTCLVRQSKTSHFSHSLHFLPWRLVIYLVWPILPFNTGLYSTDKGHFRCKHTHSGAGQGVDRVPKLKKLWPQVNLTPTQSNIGGTQYDLSKITASVSEGLLPRTFSNKLYIKTVSIWFKGDINTQHSESKSHKMTQKHHRH